MPTYWTPKEEERLLKDVCRLGMQRTIAKWATRRSARAVYQKAQALGYSAKAA
jgi:hypothetical protein